MGCTAHAVAAMHGHIHLMAAHQALVEKPMNWRVVLHHENDFDITIVGFVSLKDATEWCADYAEMRGDVLTITIERES